MEPNKEFRQAIFDASLDYLESGWLTERKVCENLRECLEFFWSGSSNQDVVRDFCLVKINRAKHETKKD